METKNTLSRSNNSTNVRTDIRLGFLRAAVGVGSKVAPFETGGWLVDAFTRTHRERQRSIDVGELLVLANRWTVDHAGRAVRGVTVRPEGSHPNEEGDGPHVVLVHGWDGGAHQMLPFVRPLVERGFVVSLFDLPGHGASEGDRTNLRDITDALHRVVRALGPVEAIVAHSMGSAAVSYATMEGMPLGRAVYIAPPTSLESSARTFASFVGATDDAVEPMLATLRGLLGHPIDADSYFRAVGEFELPLLVVHDRDDRVTSYEGSSRMVAEWPGARLVTTHGLGHARLLRDPGVIDEVVRFVANERPASVRSRAA